MYILLKVFYYSEIFVHRAAMRFVQRLAKDCLAKANIKYSLLKKYNIKYIYIATYI